MIKRGNYNVTLFLFLIVFSVSLILFLVFSTNSKEIGTEEIEKKNCVSSVESATLINKAAGRIIDFRDFLNCPVQRISLNVTEDENVIYEAFANQTLICSQTFQQNFDQITKSEGTPRSDVSSGTCYICSFISFENPEEEPLQPPYRGFQNYIENHFPHRKFLIGTTFSGNVDNSLRDPDYSSFEGIQIDLSKDYLILFHHEDDSNFAVGLISDLADGLNLATLTRSVFRWKITDTSFAHILITENSDELYEKLNCSVAVG